MKLSRTKIGAALAVMMLAVLAAAASAVTYAVGGNWLVDGTGYIKTGAIGRAELSDSGTLTFKSVISDDVEYLTGYVMRGKLRASRFDIGVWEYDDDHDYEIPIRIPPDWNPSIGDPFRLPDIRIIDDDNDITYRMEFTSETSGKLTLNGSLRLDIVGWCEVEGENVLWKEGTTRPESEDKTSGCSAGALGLAAIPAALSLTRRRRRVAALFAALVLVAVPSFAQAAEPIADLIKMPQNGGGYMPKDPDAPVVSAARQAELSETYRERFFAPWHTEDLGYLNITFSRILSYQRSFPNAKGKYFASGGGAFPVAKLKALAEAAELDEAAMTPRPAIFVKHADVRVLPTTEPIYPSAASATGARGLLKQDVLQCSRVNPGTPAAVFAMTPNAGWYFVATECVCGWVPSQTVSIVTPEFIEAYEAAQFAVAAADNVRLGSAVAKMGAILPVAVADGSEVKAIYSPVRGSGGYAELKQFAAGGVFESWPAPFTPRRALLAANQVIGEKYGWGGSGGLRDCSAMTRDYFSLFGIWLPRNSADQASSCRMIPFNDIPLAEREAALAREAVPFATLVHLKGHIMLYIGQYNGRAAVLHNMWGISVKNKNGSARVPVGKTVITSLAAGEELKGRTPNMLFINRLNAIAFPAEAKPEQ